MIAPTYAELRRLLAEATPGPWEGYTTACCADAGWVDGPHGPVCPVHIAPKMTHTLNAEDAALIAAMRNALPALLTEAEAGRKLREAIRCGYCVDGLDRCAACIALVEYDAAVAKGGAE